MLIAFFYVSQKIIKCAIVKKYIFCFKKVDKQKIYKNSNILHTVIYILHTVIYIYIYCFCNNKLYLYFYIDI